LAYIDDSGVLVMKNKLRERRLSTKDVGSEVKKMLQEKGFPVRKKRGIT